MHIRPINVKDNPALASVIRQVMEEYQIAGPGYSSNDPEIDEMFETYSQSGSCFFILENEGQIVGGGGIGPLANGDAVVCELRKMYFLASARGQGMGRKMVEVCLDAAKKMGYQKCYLETVERMEAANLLYKKMGFEALCGQMGDTGHGSCDTYFAKSL